MKLSVRSMFSKKDLRQPVMKEYWVFDPLIS